MRYALCLRSTKSSSARPKKTYTKRLRSIRRSQLGYVQLGNLKFAQKQYSDASKAYQDALNRDPNSTDALRGLINTYLAQNQPDMAVAAANAQIAKAPSNASFYYLLGSVLFRDKEDLSGAEAAFTDPYSSTLIIWER